MHLKIITHEKVVFDEDVDEIYTRGVDGEFGILKGHVPVMTALDVGVTRAVQDSGMAMFTTMGGIFQFKDDNALILTDIAESGNDIDVARAKASLERAQARLADKTAEVDAKRAEAALARAKARLKVALNK
jgi:F-type H+-transporting ATPase subunit epsilon